MNLFKGSWKTTLAGVAIICGAIGNAAKALSDDDPSTIVDWKATATALVLGWGLICARDNDKSSEAVGAKPAPAVLGGILSALLIGFIALGGTGCTALNNQTAAKEVGYWASTAVVIGGTEVLIDHPDWEPQFNDAVRAVDAVLGSTNTFSMETLGNILAQLPPETWSSRDARIGYAFLQAAIERYSTPEFSIEQPAVLREGLKSLRFGLTTAISRASEFRKSKKAQSNPQPDYPRIEFRPAIYIGPVPVLTRCPLLYDQTQNQVQDQIRSGADGIRRAEDVAQGPQGHR